MKSILTKKLLFSTIVLPVFFSGAALAQVKKPEAYLVDDRAVPARNSTNLCWHTTDWTPAKAIYECEPDLVPKKITAAAPPPSPPPAAPSPPPPPSVPSKMHFSADELFDFDKAIVKHGSPSRDQLDEFTLRLKTLNFNSINVIGYTDRIGSDQYNQRLSLRRAEAVKNYLVSRGVAAGKIRVEGRGKADPITGDRCKGDRRTKALIACLQPDRRVIVEVDGTRDTR